MVRLNGWGHSRPAAARHAQMRDRPVGSKDARYSGGGSDRPWLRVLSGSDFTVERIGRDPVTIDRLTIGVLGGIQPDRLKSLLFKSDDDGLLARFLPIWRTRPCPPGCLGGRGADGRVLARLLALKWSMTDGRNPPPLVPFSEDARS